ncbi:cytochrome c maturation protein CcmE [Kordiimonas marina]|uniref:cytochrome c maturation protein CcmE n=1 Tax=Kordiimonas marina TaxID=2872312 RepID=UPI001FF26470|nr:cytochrome c maturation protein CcmE [Kordiimonas marina]MCJ9428111.1 cytochrome c maturation protein CcmE [Kordiimonas marina]
MAAPKKSKGLKTRKRQRLVIVSAALIAIVGAIILITFALGGDSLNLYLQPSAVMEKQVPAGKRFRLGGLVATGSFHRDTDGLTYLFTVTDCAVDIPVKFKGLLPDLFREGQGVVTEGRLNKQGVFVAETVLAKHDENYTPPGTAPKNAEACSHPEALSALKKGGR